MSIDLPDSQAVAAYAPGDPAWAKVRKAIEAYRKRVDAGADSNKAKKNVQNAFARWKQDRGVTGRTLPRGDLARSIGAALGFTWIDDELDTQRKGILYLFSKIEVAPMPFGATVLDALFTGMNIAFSAASFKLDQAADSAKTSEMKAHFTALAAKTDSGSKGNDILQNYVAPTIEAGIGNAESPTVQEMKTAWGKFMAWLRAMVGRLVETMFTTLDAVGSWTDIAATASDWVLKLVNTKAAEAAGAFVGAFIGTFRSLVGGIGKSIEYARRYFDEQALRRGGVEIRDGHPQTIVKALDVAMRVDLGKTFFDALVNAGKGIAGVMATPLAASLIEMISAACSCIARAVVKGWQTSRLRRFCEEAGKLLEMKLYRDHDAFAKWYREGAVKVPFVPACTLNFAGCSNPVYFFRMMNSDRLGRATCGSSYYAAATRYIYKTSKRLLEYAQAEKIAVSTSDPLVQTVLDLYENKREIGKPVSIIGNEHSFADRLVTIMKKIGG
ncbi:hypothetical protein [Luteimonas huabeiensis]|uniref:hypothetical protein n=1 Tax=Luteimonas huabeiensis TaxID=1244513 RepID=UPI000463D571|nr:hypothetical protein [Luteimonas huabeiensis]